MVDLKTLFTLNYGLYIVSSVNKEGKINGMIANSVSQVTAEPVRIAVTLNKESLTHEYIKQTGLICVQPLTEKANMVFIGNFGFRTGRNFDKFAKITHKLSSEGLPVVTENVAAYLILKVNNSLDLGTHTMFICSLEKAEILDASCPTMTYAFYHNELKGKTPKGAVTYQK
jgi:ferric-chelate reductase [NAD(P)H]